MVDASLTQCKLWRQSLSIRNEIINLTRRFYGLTKPTKIDANLFSKVFPDVIQWLIFIPLSPTSPVFPEYLLRVTWKIRLIKLEIVIQRIKVQLSFLRVCREIESKKTNKHTVPGDEFCSLFTCRLLRVSSSGPSGFLCQSEGNSAGPCQAIKLNNMILAVFILETHNLSGTTLATWRIMSLSCYSSSVKTGRTILYIRRISPSGTDLASNFFLQVQGRVTFLQTLAV